MKTHLKLKDVIQRGSLHSTTASYVLTLPELVTDMPPAGSRGSQRQFSLRQATQLAIATQLVRAGYSVEDAGKIVRYVEKTAAGLAGIRRRPSITENYRIYSTGPHLPTDPWLLTICDDDLVSVFRVHAAPGFHDNDDFFNFRADRAEYHDPNDFLKRFQLDLSTLEGRMSRDLDVKS